MKKCFILPMIAVSCAVLVSCQAKRAERQQQRDVAFCQSIGAEGPAFTQCMLQRDSQNQANNRSAIAANQQAINNALVQPWVRRPTTTTCSRMGAHVTCNTF